MKASASRCSRRWGHGLPVLSSRGSALAEVCGEAALLVDPQDGSAIAAALTQLIQDAALREKLISEGSRRVAQFSWANAVAATRAVYAELTPSQSC